MVLCCLEPTHCDPFAHTEQELQRVLVWAFQIWMTGLFPFLDYYGNPWAAKTARGMMAARNHRIAGGHIGVYVQTVCDQLWLVQHYHFDSLWSKTEVCNRCLARNAAGPLNFTNAGPFPERDNSEYVSSAAAAASPLSKFPGFHTMVLRGEARRPSRCSS